MTMTGTRAVIVVSIIRRALVATIHCPFMESKATTIASLRWVTVAAQRPDQFVTFVTVGIVLAGVLLYYLFTFARPMIARIISSDQVDPESLHVDDRTRVLQLLARNKGHMRQTAIVESVEWSKAKVSRLLSDLEQDDEIRRVRLGRENVVYLRGYEPATLGPPFESEGQSYPSPRGHSDDGPTDSPTETRR